MVVNVAIEPVARLAGGILRTLVLDGGIAIEIVIRLVLSQKKKVKCEL